MRDMACKGPFFSKLLLNAIFFAVSKHCTRREIYLDPDDINTAGWKFRQRFAELLRDCFDSSEIPTLQALLIMSNALFSRCDERSLSWLYAGHAFNMIIDLGLHVLPSPDTIPAEELELRTRILWGAYGKSGSYLLIHHSVSKIDFHLIVIDKIQGLLQGRPPLLCRINFKASLKFLDEYEELEPFDGTSYTTVGDPPLMPSLNVSLLALLSELSLIIERILSEIYSESEANDQSRMTGCIMEDIMASLNEWLKNFPPQLDYHSSSEASMVLPQSLCLQYVSAIKPQNGLFVTNPFIGHWPTPWLYSCTDP
jgi:hypothetical protein